MTLSRSPRTERRDRPLTRLARDLVDLSLEASVIGSFSRVGYEVRRRLYDWPGIETYDLTGLTAVVTGATSGLGLATATALASSGAEVCVVGRDAARTKAAREQIEDAAQRRVHTELADLGRLDDVRTLASVVAQRFSQLDVLVHNAGALVHEHVATVDGLELTAQTHVVAPHLLTALLLPQLASSSRGGRVITVSSGGMYTQPLGLDSLFGDDGPFDGTRAYARAKRAQVVLASQWSERAATSGVMFHAMHPGWADTPGLAEALPGFHDRLAFALRSPEQGADTIAWLAAAGAGQLGPTGFWLDRHRRWTERLPWTVTSPADAHTLWNWMTTAAGLEPDFLTHSEPAAVEATQPEREASA